MILYPASYLVGIRILCDCSARLPILCDYMARLPILCDCSARLLIPDINIIQASKTTWTGTVKEGIFVGLAGSQQEWKNTLRDPPGLLLLEGASVGHVSTTDFCRNDDLGRTSSSSRSSSGSNAPQCNRDRKGGDSVVALDVVVVGG